VKWLYKVNFLFVWSCLEITIVYTVCHLKCYDVAIWMRKTVNKNHRILIDHMFSRSGWGMSYQRGCCQLSPKRLSMSSVFKLRKSDTSRGSVFLKLQSYEVCYCWGFEHILFRTSEHLHVFLLVWCTLRKHLRAVSDNLWLQCTWPKDSGPNKQVGSLFFCDWVSEFSKWVRTSIFIRLVVPSIFLFHPIWEDPKLCQAAYHGAVV